MILRPILSSILVNLFLCTLSPVLTNIFTVNGCDHQAPAPEEVNRVFIESVAERQRRDVEEVYNNIRIHLTYDESVHTLPDAKQALIKNKVMSEAIGYWEKALKTRRLSAPIRLARSCGPLGSVFRSDSDDVSDRQAYCAESCLSQTMCGDAVVPGDHLKGCRSYDSRTGTYLVESSSSEGVTDADFLLYVAATNTSRCDSSVAYATYCQLEVEYDRPIAGFINICPDGISTHETQMELAVATIKHEILHALGFSLSLYGFYRDSDGNPLTPRTGPGNLPPQGADGSYVFSDRVVKTVTRKDWRTVRGVRDWSVNMVVTPKVTAEVRRHFNCSTLEGAELENQGPSGTRLTHWEKRVFENELMTGIYTQNPAASRITLALMEDTGWYKANYALAQPLQWGSNLGCDFAQKSCFDWIDTKQSSNTPADPYCTDVKSGTLKTECTTKRTGMSLCNMHEYPTDIEIDYRYSLDNPRLGGIVTIADYCPYLQEFTWKRNGAFVRGSDCTLSSNMPDKDSNFAAEYYGTDSRCFDQTKPFKMSRCGETFVSNNFGSGCYKYECTADRGLTVYVEGEAFRCYKAGQVIDVRVTTSSSYHMGDLVCPSCEEMCSGEISLCPPEAGPPVAPVQADEPDVPCGSSSTMYTSTLNTWTIHGRANTFSIIITSLLLLT